MSTSRTESSSSLNDEFVDQLGQLIQVNLDSAAGFRDAADAMHEVALAAEFRVWAADRTRQADELAAVVQSHDGQPPQDRSWTAAVHQTWTNLRTALRSGDAEVLLIETERSEGQVEEKYEEILQQSTSPTLSDLIQQQYASVKAVHQRVRDLRDARRRDW